MPNPIQPQQPDTAVMLAKQHKAMMDAKRNLVLSSFWEFSREVISWKDLYEPLHRTLCDFIQDNQSKKRMVLLPRGHLKSSVVTVGYCLWKIAKNPKVRILIANATYPLAVTFLTQIKDHIMKNKRFVELFGDLYEGSTKWAEDAITVVREESYEAKEPTATAFGIGGSLTSQHYDLIILDDLVNRENIHTADRIEDVKTFFKDVVDLFDNPQTSELLMIGTRWHEADLYGWLLDPENPASSEFVLMKREALEGEFQMIRGPQGRFKLEGGTLLFPTKFSRAGLEKLLNDKGPTDFSSQYLNEPVPSSESTFKYEFKYYEVEDIRGIEKKTYISIDPAFFDPRSKSTDLDFAAFIVVDVDALNNWYIREIIRARMTPNEILEMMFKLDELWKPTTIGLESTAWQKILGFMAQKMMKERNHFIPITELKHAGAHAKSKTDRIQSLEPRYASGSIYHNRNIGHITTLEIELRKFPRSKHDDITDALASIAEIATPPRRHERREDGVSTALNYPA